MLNGDAYKNLPENLEKTAKGVAGAVVDGYNKISNNIRAITTPVPPTLKVNDNYSDAFKSAIAAGATPEQSQKVVEAISSTIDIAVAGRQTASNTISESSKQSDQLSSNNGSNLPAKIPNLPILLMLQANPLLQGLYKLVEAW